MSLGAAFGVTGAMVVVEFAMRVTVAYRDRFFLWILRYKPYDDLVEYRSPCVTAQP